MSEIPKWSESGTTWNEETLGITVTGGTCKHIMRVHTTDGLGNQWETCTICGMKFAHVVVAGSITERFEKIEQRVAVLEAWRGMADEALPGTITPAASEEEQGIVAFRKMLDDWKAYRTGENEWSRSCHHVLNAMDRARAERDMLQSVVRDCDITLGQRNARIRDLEAQLASEKRKVKDLDEDYTELSAEAKQLRADLARLTATGASPATPFGWVNVHKYGGSFFDNEEDAKNNARGEVLHIAVPVYEHPPHATAVTEEEITQALRDGWDHSRVNPLLSMQECYELALRPILRRMAAPEARVVGACVMRENGRVVSWTEVAKQSTAEQCATDYAQGTLGTAYQPLLGAKIATEGGR